MSKKHCLELKIEGMTCGSCEILIERKFQKIPGVLSAKVSQPAGKASIYYHDSAPSLQDLQNAIASNGYKIVAEGIDATQITSPRTKNTKRDYMEIGAVLVIILGLYLLLKQTNLFDFNIGITADMSYGFIFLIGLVAASSSCIAVTGGVLLSLAAKYNETYLPQTRLEKFKPHLLFNLGRIVSYTILGGFLGSIGSIFSIAPKTTGIISIIASIFMILMGIKILKLFPGLHKYSPKMPKFISHRILNLENKQNKGIAFLMGALTFFLPCGFTQSLQLYSISTGNFWAGALTMFFFSLGTLPALLSLSAISSFAQGKFQRYFLKFSGVLVLILGMVNITNGFALAGFNISFLTSPLTTEANTSSQSIPAAKMIDGKQIVEMKVEGYSYTPSQFTVRQGIPVEWRIFNAGAAGCGQVINVPSLGITEFMPENETKVITFTPDKTGKIPFNCTMGMMTPDAAFTVIPNNEISIDNQNQKSETNAADQIYLSSENNVSNIQKATIEVNDDGVFTPSVTTLKKGVPVELAVNVKADLGGCMSTMIIQEFGVAQLLQLGRNVIQFTPTEAGTITAMCPMGIRQTTFNIVD